MVGLGPGGLSTSVSEQMFRRPKLMVASSCLTVMLASPARIFDSPGAVLSLEQFKSNQKSFFF